VFLRCCYFKANIRAVDVAPFVRFSVSGCLSEQNLQYLVAGCNVGRTSEQQLRLCSFPENETVWPPSVTPWRIEFDPAKPTN